MAGLESPLETRIRIDWSDLDCFQHVNNVCFFRYIQASRVNYWDAIGLTQFYRETNIGPILASCKCDFKSPLYYPSEIAVFTQVEFIGTTSWGLNHRIVTHDAKVAAEAHDVMVIFDFTKNEKISFPCHLKRVIEKIEKKKFEPKEN